MKAGVAMAMTLILVSIVVLCPIVACPLSAKSQPNHSCCHKPQSHPAPCPTKDAPDCPYTILQKSKTNPGVAHAQWFGSILRADNTHDLLSLGLIAHTPCRLVNSAGLFLLNHVLLI